MLGLVFWGLLPYLSRPPVLPAEDVKARLEAGRRALREGSFHRALDELNAAARGNEQRPDLLSPEDSRQLTRLHRQARLLDRLLALSLQELLRQAVASAREDEWRRHFEREYKGRTLILDDVLHLDAMGLPELRHGRVKVGNETARLAVEDVQLLLELPLQEPQRFIFGARLARFERDGDGEWIIGFGPESGVLLTDADVLASWRPSLLTPDVEKVLRRQAEWLGDRK